jgi:hypothetical protein
MALPLRETVEIRPVCLCSTMLFRIMLNHTLQTPTTLAGLVLGGLVLLSGCGMFSDQILVTTGPEGTVYLQRLASRGATVRYSGPLKSFKANHPLR